jgi:hypothetical protein
MPVISGKHEVERGRPWFEASQGKNVSKTIFQKTSWMWWFTPVIPVTWKVEVGESTSKVNPGKKCKILSEK